MTPAKLVLVLMLLQPGPEGDALHSINASVGGRASGLVALGSVKSGGRSMLAVMVMSPPAGATGTAPETVNVRDEPLAISKNTS